MKTEQTTNQENESKKILSTLPTSHYHTTLQISSDAIHNIEMQYKIDKTQRIRAYNASMRYKSFNNNKIYD